VISFLFWYILMVVIGLLAFPLAYRVFSQLPDRGYALARPLGLLLWGFIFWLLTSLHVLQNDLGGIWLALLLLAGVGILVIYRDRSNFLDWFKTNRKIWLSIEGLFLIFFVFWALVRSANPDIVSTEKPMEMAFINAILRSPTFPPNDPWLSGYAISYYYFGYVMVALLIRVTATDPGVAFNLAGALWFALTATGAFGLLYSLINRWLCEQPPVGKRINRAVRGLGWALLGPLFLLIVSNLEGLLEILYAVGAFWSPTTDGGYQSAFWRWLDIAELKIPPAPGSLPFDWSAHNILTEGLPHRNAGWLLWRGSRVLTDYNLSGGAIEIIDEFPFFSYLLADLHPHVLAMPFVLLCIGLALQIYLAKGRPLEGKSIFGWFRLPEFWLNAIVLGGLAFLNTWDFPIYVALFSAAFTLSRTQSFGWAFRRVWEFLAVAVALGGVGIVLYFPFYLSFASQAGGLLPSGIFVTRGIHFWVMFGALLVPMLAWLIWLWRQEGGLGAIKSGGKFALWIMGGLALVSLALLALAPIMEALGRLILATPRGANSTFGNNLMFWAGLLNSLFGASNGGTLLSEALRRRLSYSGTWLTLGAIVVLAWGLMSTIRRRLKTADQSVEDGMTARVSEGKTTETGVGTDEVNQGEADWPIAPVQAFVALLALLGAGLALFPEFFFLRDNFGNRMNTIFKFYFQTWLTWSLVAAFASAVLWEKLRGVGAVLFGILWSGIMMISLVYPMMMLPYQTVNFRHPEKLTLDGTAHIERNQPDEMAAIHWLRQAPYGVIAEAIGGAYSGYARISVNTGLPTVLGWDNHESQWRGSRVEIGNRAVDIEQLYVKSDWESIKAILVKYNIRYVYLGLLERNTYSLSQEDFVRRMEIFGIYLKPVFISDTVVIYEVPNLETTPLQIVP